MRAVKKFGISLRSIQALNGLALFLLLRMGVTMKNLEGRMQYVRIWGVVATSIVATTGFSQTRWFNTSHALKIRETREECSAFQSVIYRLKQDLKERTALLGDVQSAVVVSKNALEACAKQNGLVSFKSSQEEVTLAEVCHDQYDSWLTPALQVEMVNEEVETLTKDLRLLLSHVQERCSSTQRNGS